MSDSFQPCLRDVDKKLWSAADRLRANLDAAVYKHAVLGDYYIEKLEDDPRWRYVKPPRGNASFAWIQHMFHHLAPQGSMALLLANGSMSSGPVARGKSYRSRDPAAE